jgi:hypothetical protein
MQLLTWWSLPLLPLLLLPVSSLLLLLACVTTVDMKVANLLDEEIPQIYALTGR